MAGNRGSIIPAEPAVPINPTQEQLANRQAAIAPKTVSPTVITDATFREDTKPQLNNRLNALVGNPTPQTQTEGTPLTATPTADGKWEVNGETYDASPMYSEDPQQNAIISSLIQKTDAQTKQMLGAITQQASVRKAQQEMVNKNAEAATNRALLLGGASRYAPITAGGINENMQSLGISKLADLDAQEQAAIANAKQAQADREYDLMGKALTTAENIRQEKQAAAQKILDQQTKDNEAARKAQIQASRDSAISGLLAQGVTDPNQILNYLNYDDNGNLIGDFTAKEVSDAIANLNPQQKAITDLLDTARNNGAPPDVLAKIGSSADLNSAYQAAGSYGAGGSGIVGEFNYAKANGYTGSFSDYQNEDANRKAKTNASSIASLIGNTATMDATDPAQGMGNDIISAAGIPSYAAFLVLTGQMSSLPRDQETRNLAMNQAQNWATSHGIDVSTMQSRFTAYNKVLQGNIQRTNAAQIQEQELLGTLSNIKASSADFSKLKVANVAKVLAGQQVNDPVATQYATYLSNLRNELAGYNAAVSGNLNQFGAPSPDQGEKDEAANIIKNGIAQGGLDGLETAIKSQQDKMATVLKGSVDTANKAVWDLFGVGNKYMPKSGIAEQIVRDNQQNPLMIQPTQSSAPTTNPMGI